MNNQSSAASAAWEGRLQKLLGLLLLARLLYPFFNSPLEHLFSDPQRHWENGQRFLHPTIMGSSDPFLYQLWIYLLQLLAQGSSPTVLLGCGVLCAAMPYGWYRALREVLPRSGALGGALIIGLIPESISMYAYFMNETLLLSLMGFCFWLTLRAHRKQSVAAFALAGAVWVCAACTRTVALPMAMGCMAWLWISQPQRPLKALVGLAVALVLLIPAGFHAQSKLGFFSPFGNLYFNEIYSASGNKEIVADYGPDGRYNFGCPSFYNPTFYPFSAWLTDRAGVVSIAVDLTRGRVAWKAEKARISAQRTFPRWRQRWEDFQYVMFGQSWPNSDHSTVFGWLTVWTRWLWAPLIAAVAYGTFSGGFRGREYYLALCGSGTVALLLLQGEAVMEARYRMPVDAIIVCAAWVMAWRKVAPRPSERVWDAPVGQRS
jgi:hypothetical protein